MARGPDQALIEREAAIPGLRYLLHPGQLRELLLARSGIADPGHLQAGYLRYKPGMNCIARFEFEADGRRCFAYAKAFGADAGSKLEKAGERGACSGPLGLGRVMLEPEQIVFSVFPNDAKLRSLARLEDRAAAERLVTRLFKSRPRWANAAFSALNYKPERRFVARFTNPGGESATVKFFSRPEFARVRNFRKHLRETAGVRIPGMIGGSKAHHAIAFSWLPGSILRAHLADPGLAAARAAGRAIARFHTGSQPGLERRSRRQAALGLRSLARDLGFIAPELDPRASELASALGDWWLDVPDPALPVHGDFYDKQVVVGDDGVSLIDVDNAHLGDPLSDLACFIAHLERNATNHALEPASIPAISEALIGGYRDVVPGFKARQLGRYVAFHLYQLAHNPFRDRAEDWPDQTAALLERCSDLFDSG